MTAAGIHWDLTDLYSSPKDPKINKDLKTISQEVAKLASEYKEKFAASSLNAKEFADALLRYEKIWLMVNTVCDYASLVYSIDTKSPEIGKFYQQAIELESNTSSSLTFFELGIISLTDAKFEALLKDKTIKEYEPYLRKVRVFKPYTLSEKEEIILTKKSQTSNQALVRYFDQFDSSVRYDLDVDGTTKSLSYSGLIPYLNAHKDRNVRKRAAEAMTLSLSEKSSTYGFVMNTLLADKKITDELRGHKSPHEATFLRYQMEPAIVSAMSSAIEKGYSLAGKFYKAKQKVMKLSTLHEWDRYVLPYDTKTSTYSWDETVDIVLASYASFSPRFAAIAKEFVDKKWIHAEILPAKRSGAYCSYTIPQLHPYILMNFAGEIRDVTTLAHELGHGIHGVLSREQKFLQFWPSTAIAEIASIFAESLVFDEIYSKETDKQVKANLLAEKIQNMFASIFRQNAFFLFESDIHTHRRDKGELSIEEFNSYFQKRMQAMFGDGLVLTPGHANWWMTILHFYHYPFYVFSYAFGEMLSLSLYARYKKEEYKMVEDYTRALSMGGTKSPRAVTEIMGVDITRPTFWKDGLKLIDNYIDEFIALTK
jgi:oligoendopeptidase F